MYLEARANSITALSREDALRLCRIVAEAFESALIICNSVLKKYCIRRIINVLGQILPTAYVINSAYWPFYVSIQNECLCLCNAFDIICPHILSKSKVHFIDTEAPIPPSNEEHFLKDHSPEVKLKKWFVMAQAVNTKNERFYKVIMEFQPKTLSEDRVYNTFRVQFKLRFVHSSRYLDDLWVSFYPNPRLHPSYGCHIPLSYPHVTVPKAFSFGKENVPPFAVQIVGRSVRIKTLGPNDKSVFPWSRN